MTPRSQCRRRILAGFAATIALLGLVTGPVLLLVAIYGPAGYPLPPAELTLSGQVSDTAVVDLLVAALLLTWLRWLACVAVEAVALLRGRALPSMLPLLTVWEQIAVRRLLTAVLGLLAGAAPVAGAAAAAPTPAAQVTASVPTPDSEHAAPPDRAGSVPYSLGLTSESAPLKVYRVRKPTSGRSDSLWVIAERYLHDGRRYSEIYALNKDRTQPDGQRLTLAESIRPGWTLLLPPDATGLPGAGGPPEQEEPREVTVASGDTLSGIAGRYLGDGRRYREIFTANAGRVQPDGSRFTDPDKILPGLHLDLPSPATSPTPRHRPAADRPGRSPRADGHGRRPPPTHPRPAQGPTPATTGPAQEPSPKHIARTTQGHRDWTAPAWALTGTLLAASVAGTVRFRRRRRDSRVRPGERVPSPDRRLAALHATVSRSQDVPAIERISAALASLATVASGQAAVTPVPQVLLRRPDGTIDAYLRNGIDRARAPWSSAAGGKIWTLPADAALPAVDGLQPCPTLVQVGTTDDGAELYLDLEAIGVLAIDATGAELRAVARAITATLTLSPLAGLARIRTIGFDPYGLADEERLIAEVTVTDLIDHAASDVAPIAAALTEAGVATTFALRATGATDDSYAPTVAILGTPTGPELGRLAELAGSGGRALAVIAAAAPDLAADWYLTLEPEATAPRWRLDPLGVEVTPLRLAADELADLTALLTSADAPVEPAARPAVSVRVVGAAADPARTSVAVLPPRLAVDNGPEWTVMVRLLGPVDVVDQEARPPTAGVRDRTLEVLAWLATHRNGNRVDLETAVWPGGASAGTVMNELSRARRLLRDLAGPAADDWLPARQLTLDRAVTTDLDLLRHHLASADQHADQPAGAIAELEAALDLVRGIPAGYPWLDAEIGSTLTTLPVTAATRLAELHLERGDTNRALAATTRGLTVLPAHTPLFAIRMRIAADHGPAAVRAEYEAYLRAEQADPFYDGETDRELQLLYQQLVRNLRRTSDPPPQRREVG